MGKKQNLRIFTWNKSDTKNISRDTKYIFGLGATSERTVKCWFQKFRCVNKIPEGEEDRRLEFTIDKGKI